MKNKIRCASLLAIATSTALVVLLTSGCIIRERPVYIGSRIYENPPTPPPQAYSAAPAPITPQTAVTPQPPAAPAPAVAPPTAFTYAPDSYVWDGYEYVGVYNDQYVYWNGLSWYYCDPPRVGRFQIWIGGHPDWLVRAVPYRGGIGLRRR